MQLFFLVCRPLSLFASNDNNSIVKTRFSINQLTMETAKYLGMVSSLLPPNDFYKKGKKNERKCTNLAITRKLCHVEISIIHDLIYKSRKRNYFECNYKILPS